MVYIGDQTTNRLSKKARHMRPRPRWQWHAGPRRGRRDRREGTGNHTSQQSCRARFLVRLNGCMLWTRHCRPTLFMCTWPTGAPNSQPLTWWILRFLPSESAMSLDGRLRGGSELYVFRFAGALVVSTVATVAGPAPVTVAASSTRGAAAVSMTDDIPVALRSRCSCCSRSQVPSCSKLRRVGS